LPDDSPRDVWLFEHPDGRRWIGMRAGTFLVDCAMKATGQTSADLVRTPTAALIAMCPLLNARPTPITNGKAPP
jgi:hypothetical protein